MYKKGCDPKASGDPAKVEESIHCINLGDEAKHGLAKVYEHICVPPKSRENE